MKSSRTSRLLVVVVIGCLITGCAQNDLTPISGPYFLESTKHFSFLSEPGGFEVRLVYRAKGKKTVITQNPSGGVTTDKSFSWRQYGENLVFVEKETEKPFPHTEKLSLFKPRSGVSVLDDKYDDYWKVIAADDGITCHRFQAGEKKDDPNPMFYSAAGLKKP